MHAAQVKRAIEKGNIDGAKIYAQNAIRKKTEALNYLRLASRLDAVVSRLDTQAKMNMINSSMSQVLLLAGHVVLSLPFVPSYAWGPSREEENWGPSCQCFAKPLAEEACLCNAWCVGYVALMIINNWCCANR